MRRKVTQAAEPLPVFPEENGAYLGPMQDQYGAHTHRDPGRLRSLTTCTFAPEQVQRRQHGEPDDHLHEGPEPPRAAPLGYGHQRPPAICQALRGGPRRAQAIQ
eukprot:scaffold260944_cov21-Tisochrysis_lutea.AAC.1